MIARAVRTARRVPRATLWLLAAAAVLIASRPGQANASPCADAYDPNELCSDPLATLGTGTYPNLVLSGYDDTHDRDWYRIHLRQSERLTAAVTFSSSTNTGELGLDPEGGCIVGPLLAYDVTPGTVRVITYTNTGADADFYLAVSHYDPGTCRLYTMQLVIAGTGDIDNTVTRAGWTAPIVPRNGTTSPSGAIVTPTLDGEVADSYLNWSFSQTGPTSVPGYDLALSLDDVTLSTGYNPGPSAPQNYFYINLGPYSVRGGRHTLKSVSDQANNVPETNESNNTYTTQYLWSPKDVTRATPLVRALPPSPGPFGAPFLNSDGFRYARAGGLAWVVSEAARNPNDDYDLSVFDDYAGSTSGFSNLIGNSRWGGNHTDFVVGHFSGTPATVYPAVQYFANLGGGSNYAIDQIDAASRNGTPDAASSWTGQVLGANRLADVYEAYMTAGTTWYLDLKRTSGTSDLLFEVFPGTTGEVHSRGQGYASLPYYGSDVWDALGPYHATETGWHPIVVYRDLGTGADQPVTYDFAYSAAGLVGVTPATAGEALAFLGVTPNPVVTRGTFAFVLPTAERATLSVFDLGGRRVRALADGVMGAGRHEVAWDGRDASGTRLGAGMYWARFTAQDATFSKPIVVVR